METSEHRALADASRARIVEELAGSGGLDTPELARRLTLHPNTLRWHLGILEDAGLVSSAPVRRGRRGRPRVVYRLEPGATSGRDEYRLLATILSPLVESEHAEQAGRTWGAHLAPESSGEPVQAVATLLAEQGFAPEIGEGEIRMRRCPFYELALEHPHVVCRLHKGIVDGALERLGSPLRVAELDILAEPDLCVARLASRI